MGEVPLYRYGPLASCEFDGACQIRCRTGDSNLNPESGTIREHQSSSPSQLPNNLCRYRGTSLMRKRIPLGPFRRPVPRVLCGSQGGGRFLMGEVPLYTHGPVASYEPVVTSQRRCR